MLITSELFLEAVQDFAFVALDSDGVIQSCNKATLDITGFSNAELHNQSFSILFTDGDIDRRRSDDILADVLKYGKVSSESWKAKKDGSRYWAFMSISVCMQNDVHIGFAVVIKDLSDKKAAEIQIKKKEERYRLIVESVRDYAIFMLDREGYIQSWNDGAERIKGYKREEIVGRHFSTFYTGPDLESGKPAMELRVALQTGKYEEEGWRVRKNGSLFWANVVITSLFNEQNEFIGYSKVTRDLSQKKYEEERLRQSEERYRLLVEQVKDYGIFMLDEKGRIVSWNEGAQRMMGYTSEDILGKYFSIFYPEEDKLNERPAQELKVAREFGKYEEEGWRVRKNGAMFWANVVITAVYNENGVFIGYSKVTRDLTERKEAENALKESRERFRLLAKQLRESNVNLAHVNKELEEFTSIASHDLQEPVRTIKSFLTLIDKKLLDPKFSIDEFRTYIQKAIKASNRMRELILNLLQYAQLSKEEVIFDDINVTEFLGEVLQNLKGTIESTGASVTVNSTVNCIKGDHIQLMQLVQNLLTNALKFVENNAPQIQINCGLEHGHVLFAIKDNGIGISKDSQHKIFEIFRREHTAMKYPGTGIGLAICKKIVERHKGKIWLESELGQGTTFYFTLNDNVIN